MELRSALVFALCVVAATAGPHLLNNRVTQARDIWVDPVAPPKFNVTVNVTSSTFAVGQAVEFRCEIEGLPLGTETLQWKQRAGNWEIQLDRGRNPLVFTKIIQATDNAADIFCFVTFTETLEGQFYVSYNHKSDPIPLSVVGDVPAGPTIPNYAFGQSVAMESTGITAHRVGDLVEFYCYPVNINFAFIEMRQAKGGMSILTARPGYNPRWLVFNMTAADADTTVYCEAWGTDDRWNSYMIESQHIPITILS